MKLTRSYDDDTQEVVNVNIGGLFSTLLLVAFIVLKLCHIIEWSWVWVLSPLWIPLALVLVVWAIAVIAAIISAARW